VTAYAASDLSSENSAVRRFGRNLQAARESAGITQVGLAGLAGLTDSRVQKLEAGEAEPTLALIVRLARALNVPTRQLIAGI
jgi:transcriptional regulator with XRE-family HTH domain